MENHSLTGHDYWFLQQGLVFEGFQAYPLDHHLQLRGKYFASKVQKYIPLATKIVPQTIWKLSDFNPNMQQWFHMKNVSYTIKTSTLEHQKKTIFWLFPQNIYPNLNNYLCWLNPFLDHTNVFPTFPKFFCHPFWKESKLHLNRFWFRNQILNSLHHF